MTSFQSKIHRRRARKRENENYCSDPFLPALWLLFNPKYVESQEREKIKIIAPIRSYPTHN